jgi:hypothetical protein
MRNLALLLLLVSTGLLAQNGKFPMGARQASIGGAAVTLTDQWSLFNNVGALGLVSGDYGFTSYQNRFGISELSTIGAGYVKDFGSAAGGIGFYRFGDEYYSEQRVNLGYGHTLDMVSLGLSIDYLQYSITTVGSRGVVVLEFGGVAELTEKISFGAHIFNLNQANLVKDTGEKIPTVMKAGVSFRPSDDLMFNVETEKNLDFDEVFKAGLEYRIVEKVILRTGFRTAPFQGSFGIGFQPKKFQFDYAFGNDTNLGATHELSISYRIKQP